MLPTPGNSPIRLEVRMNMKNVAASGKTQRATFGSSTPAARSSRPSTVASKKFCAPDGTSFILRVPRRTNTKITTPTTHV